MQNISRKIVEKGRKYVNILGIRVNGTPIDRLLASLEDNITHNVRFYIVTPNPELVLMAQKDGQLKLALNSTAFSIPDGMGLAQAAKNSWKVYFLGGESGEAALAAKKLGETYKKVRIEAESGPMFNNQGE